MNPTTKKRVAVLFGGKSAEHEVSLTSAVSILNQIDRDRYEVLAVRISREGRWDLLREPTIFESVEELERSEGFSVVMGGAETQELLISGDEDCPLKKERIDVVFPVLHGNQGEDGTIQGVVQLAGLPCVGAGVMASAICMDKVLMKQVFFQNELAATDYMWFLRKDWERGRARIIEGIDREIGYPCFVKPANTGSSIGVSKAHDALEIRSCVDRATDYDRKILVERAVVGKELECSVLGNDDPEASVVGEIVPCHEFYDYDAKYIVDGTELIIPADVPTDISEQIKSMAIAAFKAVDCSGMARIDFFLEAKTQRVLLNEINTIPGFTPISMYPKLWEAGGLSYSQLIDRLLELALERYDDLSRNAMEKEPTSLE